MNAGDLIHRVTLLRVRSFESEGALEAEERWLPFGGSGEDAGVWAHHAPALDAEQVRAAAIGATLSDRFTLRWTPELADLSAADRLRFGGAEYDIGRVKPVYAQGLPRPDWLEVTATASSDGDGPDGAGEGGA